MLKFDQFELYLILYNTLKKVYSGEVYLIIESITFDFDDEEENELLSLLPWGYTVKGRYGREQNSNPPLDETFKLSANFDDSLDVVAGKFESQLLN